MKYVEKRNIIKKIDFFTFGFIFALSVTIISSASSLYYTFNIFNGLKNMYEIDVVGANYIQKARIDLLNIENEQKNILLSEKNDDLEKNMEIVISYKKEFINNMQKAEPLFTGKAGKKYFNDAYETSEKYFNVIEEFLSNIKLDKKKAVIITLKEASRASRELDSRLDRLDNYKQSKNLKFYSTVVIIFQANLLIVVLVLLISIIIRIFVYIKQRKHIKKL